MLLTVSAHSTQVLYSTSITSHKAWLSVGSVDLVILNGVICCQFQGHFVERPKTIISQSLVARCIWDKQIHMHTLISIHTHTCTHARTQSRIYTHIHTHIYIYIYIYIYINTHAHTHLHTHTHIRPYTPIYTHTHTLANNIFDVCPMIKLSLICV